jgi:hypothetical protein
MKLRINHMFHTKRAKHHKLWQGDLHRREDTAMPAPATHHRRANPQRRSADHRRWPPRDWRLREQLGGHGDPRRVLAVWQQSQPQHDMASSDQLQIVAPPPLPLNLATHAAGLTGSPAGRQVPIFWPRC